MRPRPSVLERLRFCLELKDLLGDLLSKLHDRHAGNVEPARLELAIIVEHLDCMLVTDKDVEVDA